MPGSPLKREAPAYMSRKRGRIATYINLLPSIGGKRPSALACICFFDTEKDVTSFEKWQQTYFILNGGDNHNYN